MLYDLLIIGGGVSGFAAAITAARRGKTVCILEQGRKPLRKLAASGNGRGNLFHLQPKENRYHGDAAFAMQVLGSHAAEEAAAFWQGIGVSLTTEQEVLVYPSSLWAQSAVDALLYTTQSLQVTMLVNANVQNAVRTEHGFLVSGMQGVTLPAEKRNKKGELLLTWQPAQWQGRQLLICGGGRASLQEDAPDAYALVRGFGHRQTPLTPALCALCTRKKPAAPLVGVRVRCACSLLAADGQCKRTSCGEALFAKDGVSGIAVMDLARHATQGDWLSLDLRQAACADADADLSAWLQARCTLRKDALCGDLLTGALHPAIGAALLERCELNRDLPVSQLTPSQIQRLAHTMQDFRYELESPRPLQQAQVTAGGIETDGFHPQSLQSRLQPGLYCAGEMLNVDGDCGGFNLLFAAISGMRVGNSV